MPAVIQDQTYYVGEFPTDAMAIELIDYQGNPYDLGPYESFNLLVPAGLPSGNTVVHDIVNSILYHTWTTAFTTVGTFEVQVRLVQGIHIDYAPPFKIFVMAAAGGTP